jgi:eukaryotic-like serine/threonine-protein kinase
MNWPKAAAIAAVACAIAAITALVGQPTLGRAAATATVVAILGVIGVLTTERAKAALERRDAERRQVATVVFQPGGHLLPVREMSDPIALGVRRAAPGGSGSAPSYVPRDFDPRLRAALRGSGFTLVVGEAAVGKSRSAYEAMRAVLPGHLLIAPSAEGGDLTATLGQARSRRETVLWLDNLPAFLHDGRLTRKDVAELLAGDGHYRVILATIRAADESQLLGGGSDDLLGAGQGILDQVDHRVFAERLFSASELVSTRDLAAADQRLDDALTHAGDTGVAEYLACGPQLFKQWQDAWIRGISPRAAALIAAAVDCRRAGFAGPIPRPLLNALHEDYLREHGGAALIPEDLAAAWTWTLSLRGSGSAPLRPITDDSCDVFGYLVDEYRRRPGEPLPEATARAALEYAGPADANGIAMVAWAQGRNRLTRDALLRYRDALAPGDPALLAVQVNLSVVALRLDGYQTGLFAAEDEFRSVLATAEDRCDLDPGFEPTVRGKLANVLLAEGKLREADSEYRAVVAARTALYGPENRLTLFSRNNLGVVLTAMDDLDAAEDELGAVLELQRRLLGADHPDTKLTERNLKAALARRSDG